MKTHSEVQPFIKLLRRLKDKSSKIIYTHNVQLKDRPKKHVKYDIQNSKHQRCTKNTPVVRVHLNVRDHQLKIIVCVYYTHMYDIYTYMLLNIVIQLCTEDKKNT